MLGWRPLAAFLLVVGIVLSPFRAVAATIPTLIAHDLAAFYDYEGDAVPTEPKRHVINAYDGALLRHDYAANPQVIRGADAVHTYDRALEHAYLREVRPEGPIYDAAFATTAAEGLEAAGGAAKFTASTPQSAIALSKQLASEAQLGEMAAGTGERIAGVGARAPFRDAGRIAQTYGGNAADWVKMSSSGFRAADGTTFQTHWVENIVTGAQVEPKVTIDVFGGP